MFLFDNYKTGRQKYNTGNKVLSIRWKTYLNTYPPFGAESTAVCDNQNNYYFGSHSGNFYSLTDKGEIRWSFFTKKKIYGSPVLFKNTIIFIGGDGMVYCLEKDNGLIIWKRDLKDNYYNFSFQKLKSELIHLPYTFNLKRKMWMNTKSWSSPLLMNNIVIATGFGKGIYAFDVVNGKELWSYDLGFPRYHLCGIVLDEENNIYCISRNGHLYCFSLKGEVIWRKKVIRYYSSWGNPSYNISTQNVYCIFSKGELKGLIKAIDIRGNEIWKLKLHGAIHGSVSISQNGKILYCCDFDGYLYKIDAVKGAVISKIKLSDASRALWTTPTLDSDGNILISTKDSLNKGRIIKLNSDLQVIWEYHTDKVLSIPLIKENGDVSFGAWDGYYYCIITKNK